MHKVIHGDCKEEMSKMADNSVDAIVTDPPYDLTSIVKRFGKENSAPAKFGNDGAFQRVSKRFMGKEWDGTGIAFKVDLWKEAYRVLKPGGHLISFGGTRTYHRMACAIEDAGFEVRDMIEWVYGSGFPKSLNIGKAVDKLQGNEREFVSNYQYPDGHKRINHIQVEGTSFKSGGKEGTPITKDTSDWEGYGTALKPAHEPMVLARKPLSEKSVAENCLKWGTGGLDIDGCSVKHNEPEWHTKINPRNSDITFSNKTCGFNSENTTLASDNSQGRFPANLIHDGSEEVMAVFPDTKAGVAVRRNSGGNTFGGDNPKPPMEDLGYKDNGSAARFFYCAKASKAERNIGCEGLEEKIGGGMQGTADQTLLTGNGNIRNNKAKNFHPTVKPLALMLYLVKLISREGQVVLDPFCGSGTTGMACKKLNRQFIGIEQDSEYIPIANCRIAATKPPTPEQPQPIEKQLSLF